MQSVIFIKIQSNNPPQFLSFNSQKLICYFCVRFAKESVFFPEDECFLSKDLEKLQEVIVVGLDEVLVFIERLREGISSEYHIEVLRFLVDIVEFDLVN